jgi:glycosyltransferase involved in cell wall biosynthesis
MFDVVFLTPGALGSNPRVVKAASACSEVGWSVAVVSARRLAVVEPLDDDILLGADWTSHRLDLRSNLRWRRYRLEEEARRLLRSFVGKGHPTSPASSLPLLDRAKRLPARLYVAHYVAALPVAAEAAAKYGARFAFDAEDFHSGEFPKERASDRRRREILEIEAAHLPSAAFVTAAAPLIASAYEREYGIARPSVVLNVFPKRFSPKAPTEAGTAPHRPSLYWFSQTIGPDRGLECALRAIALTRTKPHLFLRGNILHGYDRVLGELARKLGIEMHLHLLAPGLPSQMELLAAEHDLGLISETGHTTNRQIALTNKQFSYLSAGVPILMSDVPGHVEFAREVGAVAGLFEVNNHESLAQLIDARLENPLELVALRRRAFELAQSRYNWDIEKSVLVSRVAEIIGNPHA